jgi:hypothetical protein
LRRALLRFTELLKGIVIFVVVIMSPVLYRLRRGRGDPGSAVGRGTRLFTSQTAPAQLRLASADTIGPAVLLRYERARG